MGLLGWHLHIEGHMQMGSSHQKLGVMRTFKLSVPVSMVIPGLFELARLEWTVAAP
jgi:formate hydrogenlyase subunit 4